jgi:hypothetical protein
MIDSKCSCDSEVRYLDVTCVSELRHCKEAVKRFLVAVSELHSHIFFFTSNVFYIAVVASR